MFNIDNKMESQILREDVEVIVDSIKEEASKLSGKTLLITGGAGFLGRYFILTIAELNKKILEKPCRIISIDNFITGSSYGIEEGRNFKSIKHDVAKPLRIKENIDYIIIAAGIASPKFYRKFIIETIDAGIFGTKNMLELAKDKNVKSALYFSSSEVYGDPDPQAIPTPETYFGNVSCTGPRANYDESKRVGETLCVSYYHVYKTPIKIVRPFNVYGPGMRLDDNRVIPNFVSSILKGKPVPVYGAGNNTRTFCYVTDALAGFFKILFSDYNGEAFNVGNSDNEVNMATLAKIVAEISGNNPEIKNIEGSTDAYMSGDPKRRCPDLTKIKEKLNYSAKVNLKTGIRRFIQWAKETQITKKL